MFSDIDTYLRNFGFVLFDFLNLEKWSRKTITTNQPDNLGDASWYCTGQLIWGQALYLKDWVAEIVSARRQLNANDQIKLLKLASLAELFKVPDYAIELLQTGKEVGIMEREEIEKMMNLLDPKQRLDEDFKHLNGIRRFKQISKMFIPSSFRGIIRGWLETMLSS